MNLLERLDSALRERRITRLGRKAIRHAAKGERLDSRIAFLRMSREIEQRTPEQVLRMERARRLERRREP